MALASTWSALLITAGLLLVAAKGNASLSSPRSKRYLIPSPANNKSKDDDRSSTNVSSHHNEAHEEEEATAVDLSEDFKVNVFYQLTGGTPVRLLRSCASHLERKAFIWSANNSKGSVAGCPGARVPMQFHCKKVVS